MRRSLLGIFRLRGIAETPATAGGPTLGGPTRSKTALPGLEGRVPSRDRPPQGWPRGRHDRLLTCRSAK